MLNDINGISLVTSQIYLHIMVQPSIVVIYSEYCRYKHVKYIIRYCLSIYIYIHSMVLSCAHVMLEKLNDV